MRFALLGDHADGLDMARALAASGRHELAVYSGPPEGLERLRRWGIDAAQVGDLEEILADPLIDGIIVASAPALRSGQLRRALQSERHVLCIHPADARPDLAYEASLLRQDSGKALFPLMPEALHPAFARFRQLMLGLDEPIAALERAPQDDHVTATSPAAIQTRERQTAHPAATPTNAGCLLGAPQLLMTQRWLTGPLGEEDEERPTGLPGWAVLRLVGGEVAELMALSPEEELLLDQPLLFTGRFVGGLMFQGMLLPRQVESREVHVLVGSLGQVTLEFPFGWPGEARLSYRDADGHAQAEEWAAFDPWPAMVSAFEETMRRSRRDKPGPASSPKAESLTQGGILAWQDEIRALELDDAARRSVGRRRASVLDYQEVTEEASFKGAMTLVGCSLLWISLMLLILSVWVPWLGWFILPVVAVFLLLQFLGWAVPPTGTPKPPGAEIAGKQEPKITD
ncbi:MAG: hypothetical protein U0793_04030 [Gemmataceae bacterium]